MKYFNINGAIGCGKFGPSAFVTLDDLLDHMDAMGVACSLTWQLEAQDWNAGLGNAMLLEAIENNPRAKGRIIPSAVVNPETAHDPDAVQTLRKQLENKEIAALRICPAPSGYAVGHLWALLKQLDDLAPVLVWSLRAVGPSDGSDMVQLLDTYPLMKLICTEAMWGDQKYLYDLMSRSDRVLADISWLHVNGAISALITRFGADRVVFGLGHKTHHAAAMAACSHAEISDGDRAKITHQNSIALLGLPEDICDKSMKAFDDKPLCKQFLAGKAMPAELGIIDAHAHCGCGSNNHYIYHVDHHHTLEHIIATMDRMGIAQTLVSSFGALFGDPVSQGDACLAEMKTVSADRIKGYVVYNPWYGEALMPKLDAWFASGLYIGFKLLAGYWRIPLDDKRYEPVWQYAHKYRLPILLHTWSAGMDDPAMLRDVYKKYPDAFFLLGHAGGGGCRANAEAMAKEFKNVYLEFCGSFTAERAWEDTLENVGADKVLFGTDAYSHDTAWELGRLLSVPVDDELLKPILSGNMRRILAARRAK